MSGVAIEADAPAAIAKAAADPPIRRLPTGLKAFAGAGQLVESTSTTLLSTFLFFYYTALLGLPGSLVGAATAISLVIDAVADPLLGSWSDAARTRWGRRTPFMLVGAPVVALATGLAFSPPHGLTQVGVFAWLVVTSLALRFSVSTFQVPFSALGAEMSTDYAERSSVVAWRTLYSILGPLVVLVLGYSVFLGGGLGLRRAAGYAPLAWSGAAIMLGGGLLSVLAVGRFAAALPTPPREETAIHLRFVGEVAEIFANPSFRVLFTCAVLFYAAQGVAGSLGQYMNLFIWKLTSAQIQQITFALFIGLVVGVPTGPMLGRRMEKRSVVMIGLVMLCLAQGGLSGLRALHLFTASGTAVIGPLALNSFFAGIGLTMAGVSMASMMADAADEHDFLFGTRREGLYFAGLAFAGKAATGLGALVAGLALDAIRFPRMSAVAAAPAVSPGTLDALVWSAGPFVATVSLVATLLLGLYRIDRRRHAEVSAALRVRGGAGR